MHSISSTIEACAFCDGKDIKKLVGKPSFRIKAPSQENKVGELTNDYIDKNRELLKQMKEESSSESID